jgi:uncharacterized protein
MALLERDKKAPAVWRGDLPVTNRYTAGLGGERFLRALKDEGRILGTRCVDCDVTYVPGRVFCERCLAEIGDWVDVGTVGEVHTYTVVFEDLDGRRRETPAIVALVSLGDGGLVHYLGDVVPEDVFIGMPVEAVFKPAAERTGSVLDIAYFRPA